MHYDNVEIVGHYYLPERYHNLLGTRRIASELVMQPIAGQLVILSPYQFHLSDIPQYECGLYRVINTLPNQDQPEDVFDYSLYPQRWFMKASEWYIVRPIYTVVPSEFMDYGFRTRTMVDNESGVISYQYTISIADTGEILEQISLE